MRILPINVGRTHVQNPLDFVTALLVDRHERGRLRRRGGESQIGDWKDNALFARDRTVDKAAEKLGYGQRIPPQKAPFNSHGQDVYWNGKNYITPDVDGHNVSDGWKIFDRRGNRLGTYDKDLKRIKD